MSTFFSYFPILVKYDHDHYEDTHLCLATQQQKSKLAIYTISLIVVVFLPVILIFIWFYYNIALMLWRHRKKFQETTKGGNNIVTESNIASSNKKLKSFVVIIVLTVAFVSFRLPSYIFNIVIMSNVYETSFVWNMVFSLNCLMIVNCILNPLLYTFLNQTVNILHRLQGVMVKILLWCCCFTNTDIDELERYSPFYCDNHSESQRTNTGTTKKMVIKTAQETTSSPLVIGKVTPLERYWPQVIGFQMYNIGTIYELKQKCISSVYHRKLWNTYLFTPEMFHYNLIKSLLEKPLYQHLLCGCGHLCSVG